jgi:hypothetical protein
VSASRGLIPAKRIQRHPFFFAGEYPVSGKSESCFSWPSWKRFDTPACCSNAGDAGEEGGRTASATLLFVTAVKVASGNGGKGVSFGMMTFFGLVKSFGGRRRSSAGQK